MAGLNAIPLTASIANNGTMTVTFSPSSALGIGQTISGPGVPSGEQITALGTGIGGTGTYTVSPAPSTAVSSEAMTASGIPNRTTIYKTLSPSGGDDTAAIQSALNACPAGQVVLLTTGVFQVKNPGLVFSTTNCTLRGSGPGQQLNTGLNKVDGGGTVRSCASGTLVTLGDGSYCTDSTATMLINQDRANTSHDFLDVYPIGLSWGASYSLAADAVQGAYSITLTSAPGTAINPGDLIIIDQDGQNDPALFYSYQFSDNSGSQYWNTCPDTTENGLGTNSGGAYRNICQMVEVASTSNGGKTITFDVPLTYPFHTSATCAGCAASITVYSGGQPLHGVGIENLFIWGGANGNIAISECAYCWVRNVESAWMTGPGNIQLTRTFRNVVRDSFMHETPQPAPGGGGYQFSVNTGASENLIENNIMWYGNKEIVMPVSGGGNVVAYNYMDDAFGDTYPDAAEAGMNAGHRLAGHMELLEGNYSQNFKGDDYWGGSPYVTAFRNQFSQHRAARAPLKTYVSTGGGCTAAYGDFDGGSRAAVDLQAGSSHNAFVGNVLGTSGQSLLPGDGCIGPQGAFLEQTYTTAQYATANNANDVSSWQIGFEQKDTGNTWLDSTVTTITRTANWDWCCSSPSTTGAERCYDRNGGMGGTTDQGCSGVTVPKSFYLGAAPAFFGTHTWPWVDPTTGTTYTLPAMYCFQNNKMPTCPIP